MHGRGVVEVHQHAGSLLDAAGWMERLMLTSYTHWFGGEALHLPPRGLYFTHSQLTASFEDPRG